MSTAVETALKQRRVFGRPFPKGVSGNPAGRPKSARSAVQESFLREISADFEKHGADVIRQVRETKPDVYLRVVADLMPKDVSMDVSIDHRVEIAQVLTDFRGLGLPDPALKRLLRMADLPKVIDAEPE